MQQTAWLWLLAAGAVEIAMAISLKFAQGWTRPIPSVLGIVTALASVFLLTHAMRGLPAGTAYAIWTGIGSVGVTLLGVLVFGESMQPARLACIGLVIAGTVGLNFFNAA
ncbi:DMT family transporter [Ralstonia insidiosa]|uniref:Guanidinium exporter n=1 Tax=Ralstonia insidiosa TaxID=190721 RepID=A0A848P5Z2_9RALS|nr:multidrug efflux SMR transporter [Ralstonia insidiosa]NMV40593.1 multidrug efflux SMR transporter [Ralstonia insidiosa]